MKGLLALAMIMGLLASSPCMATERVDFDGAWWQTLSEGQKLIAVEGFIVAYTGAYDDAIQDACTSLSRELMKRVPACVKVPMPAILDLSMGEFVKRMNHRFGSPKARRTMIAPALYCILVDPGNCHDIP